MSSSDSEEYDYEIISEETYEHNYNLAEETMNRMREEIEQSENPWLLSSCSTSILYDFIDTGNFQPLQHYRSLDDDNVNEAPEPINYLYEEDPSEWTIMRKDGTIVIPVDKEEMEKEKILAQQKIRAKADANKHNWNLTRKERGLPEIVKPVKMMLPKIVAQKPKRKFKVNKSYSSICKQ